MGDTAHHHITQSGAALANAAEATLRQHGERWTDMRADIFAALSAQSRPQSAYDIAESVGQKRGKRVAANSVYRILDLFVATNLAKRIEVANAYIANSHPGCLHDCLFLVCASCGGVTHVDDDGLADALRQSAKAAGFTPDHPVMEVRGTCRDCAAL